MSFQDVMIELRAEYLKGFPNKISLLKINLAINNIEELELEFHKMKGTGATYGIPEISVIGEIMETCCLKKPELLEKAIPAICNILNFIIAQRTQNIETALTDLPEFKELLKMIL